MNRPQTGAWSPRTCLLVVADLMQTTILALFAIRFPDFKYDRIHENQVALNRGLSVCRDQNSMLASLHEDPCHPGTEGVRN